MASDPLFMFIPANGILALRDTIFVYVVASGCLPLYEFKSQFAPALDAPLQWLRRIILWILIHSFKAFCAVSPRSSAFSASLR